MLAPVNITVPGPPRLRPPPAPLMELANETMPDALIVKVLPPRTIWLLVDELLILLSVWLPALMSRVLEPLMVMLLLLLMIDPAPNANVPALMTVAPV